MFLDKLKEVKAFVLDIDGVLTDGTVHVTETGEQLRRFHVRDGYAMQRAVKKGYRICVISGGKSASVLIRLNGLGITEIHLGIDKKLDVYQEFLQAHSLEPTQVLYMGDDIPDIPPMKLSGVPVCPGDAVEEVKAVSIYISGKAGGTGCVRDVIEKVLKIQGNWYDPDPSAQDDTITSV
ncbi:KdsC family phosphatase [Pararcticibacter amylolyticus]|uniref:3-deoxy-D-manno-octulosonate 8-phosphate phosphatase n=1 Tax=Pararcticibacter amylolyticus TaxID=2173175 RepID=A0A2U2PJX4_9SPHI|nr:HAD-IIIA family hydrolase [Pararcticibacter amylolyticus]PWG81707.1 3-deoxy-D-manno-octulosonate 8-phosphate phosphatase [Pararcticibacter amylolyticus]